MKRRVIGAFIALLGAVGLFSLIWYLATYSDRSDIHPAYIVGLVAYFLAPISALLAVALVAAKRTPVTIALAVMAALHYFVTFVFVIGVPNWSGVNDLMECVDPCGPPDHVVRLVSAWIAVAVLYVALAIAWSRSPRTVVLLALAAIPLANVAVFLATPSTRRSTTAPRSQAAAETGA